MLQLQQQKGHNAATDVFVAFPPTSLPSVGGSAARQAGHAEAGAWQLSDLCHLLPLLPAVSAAQGQATRREGGRKTGQQFICLAGCSRLLVQGIGQGTEVMVVAETSQPFAQ